MKKFTEIQYQRPNLEDFANELKTNIEAFKNSQTAEEQRNLFLKISNEGKKIYSSHAFVEVKFSQNTKDEFFANEKDYFDAESPRLAPVYKEFGIACLAAKFRSELEKEFGKQFFDLTTLQNKIVSEEIVPLLQKENELSASYQKIKSEIKVDFDGKTYNLSGMSPLMENTDREYRKAASKAYYAALIKAQPEFDRIYDELVKVRVEMATKLGYDNFVQMGYDRMGRTCYDASNISTYRGFIEKYVTPKVAILKDRIREKQGLDVMYHYDTLLFSDGNATPKTSPEQMIADAQVMYNELSPETGKFFKQMIDLEVMDLLNRENKSPGGYCTYIDEIKSPFIFSNFNGTSHDVDVLTHEAGHAFQCYCSTHFEVADYFFPTSESAEIHSMSMEFFAWNWVDKFFKEDTDKYKLGHLLKSLFFLPYGVTVDEFQQNVYENPNLSPEGRRNMWNEVSKKYSPWVKVDNEPFLENGGRWQPQAHIYQSPFYYIDYTLAQLCAFQFYKKMNENFDQAWQDYHRLCQKGGSLNFLELLDVANLSSPFDEKGFSETIDFIFAEIERLFNLYFEKKQAQA